MIAILESKQPDDFILATGITHSLKDFLSEAFAHIGISDWSNYVVVDRDLFRPADVFNVVGNNSKASNLLGWKPKIEFRSIVQKMVDYDLEKLRNQDDDLFWKCD
jgi:GDPmannose 4,6-dehydratase